jgi:hypothetical protein
MVSIINPQYLFGSAALMKWGTRHGIGYIVTMVFQLVSAFGSWQVLHYSVCMRTKRFFAQRADVSMIMSR